MNDAPPESARGRGLPLLLGLSLPVSIGILVTALLAVYINTYRYEDRYNAEIRNRLGMTADNLAPQLVNAMTVHDYNELEDIMIAAVGSDEQVDDALVILSDGDEVFYDMTFTREGKPFSGDMLMPGVNYTRTPIILTTGLGYGLVVSTEKLGELILGVREKNVARNEHVQSVAGFARGVSDSMANSIALSDYLNLRQLMNNMAGHSDKIIYAQLLRPDGTILFYTELGMEEAESLEMEGKKEESELGRNALEVSPRKALHIQYTTGPGDVPVMDIAVPVMRKGEKIGVVRIGYSMEEFLAEQARGRAITIGVAAAFTIVGLIFSVWTAWRIAAPIRTLATAARRVGQGDLEQRPRINSGGRETRELGDSFNQMIAGLKERDFVKETFSRYVTKQVAEEILRDPDRIAPGGTKREVTILFSDIRGFTTFSEDHSPEDVIAHLNEYLAAMVDIIFKYEGTLDKYIGDAIMAVYGSPLPHEDDPLRAVRTALEMQEILAKLNDRWETEGKPPLRIGIGINTGDVIAGNIGDVRRMEYTVIGDNVNLASRIESLTKNFNCPIIISGSTYAQVRDAVEVKELEEVTVKGKSRAVRIYELLGLK